VGQIVERDKITEAEAMSQIDASIALNVDGGLVWD
jgi:hypothetical protein